MRRARSYPRLVGSLTVAGLVAWLSTGVALPSSPLRARAATTGAVTPIQHVVIILKENRSFDNFFGTFPGANGATTFTNPQFGIITSQANYPRLIQMGVRFYR